MNARSTDQLPGGRADHHAPEDFDPEALAEGTRHEREHTNDPDLAREIAMDHLAEDPDYYDDLDDDDLDDDDDAIERAETAEARRKRNARPHNRAARRAYMRSKSGRAANRQAQENYRARHPERVAAQHAARHRVGESKDAKRSCAVCGKPAEHKHHTSYGEGRETNVRWLCHVHHVKAHHPKSDLGEKAMVFEQIMNGEILKAEGQGGFGGRPAARSVDDELAEKAKCAAEGASAAAAKADAEDEGDADEDEGKDKGGFLARINKALDALGANSTVSRGVSISEPAHESQNGLPKASPGETVVLSEDDRDVSEQMSDGQSALERMVPHGSAQLSALVAERTAPMSKAGEQSGAAQTARQQQAAMRARAAEVMTQNTQSLVGYSTQEDARIARLQKSNRSSVYGDAFGEPTFDLRSPIMNRMCCGMCKSSVPAMLASCPSCGHDHSGQPSLAKSLPSLPNIAVGPTREGRVHPEGVLTFE